MLDGAAEIVADGEHVAGKIGNGVAGGIGLLALGAAAHILHLRHGAEQPVAHIGVLGDERLKLGARLRGWIGALRIGSGVARLILGAGIGLFV